jgi:hypothetical protein
VRVRVGSSRARTRDFTLTGVGTVNSQDGKKIDVLSLNGREAGTDATDGPSGRIYISLDKSDGDALLADLLCRLVSLCETNGIDWRKSFPYRVD